MSRFGHIQVEGWKPLRRDIRRAVDQDMPRRMGQAHRNVGLYVKRLVDARSDPAAVGAGRGADVRPSSSRREVLVRVGYGTRKAPVAPWGIRQVQPVGPRPPRPHIVGIINDDRASIEREFFDQVMAAAAPPFYSTSEGFL